MQYVKRYDRLPQQEKTEQLLGKTLPFNLAAERSVLGTLLVHAPAAQKISELLRPEDFYRPAHHIIYEHMLAVTTRREQIDILTLQNELLKSHKLEEVGGIDYLLSLQEEIPSIGLVEQHAKIIKEKAVLRELIQSATDILSTCYAQDDRNIESIIDEAEKTIFQISNKRSNDGFIQLNIWMTKTFQHLSNLTSSSRGITGVASGLPRFDSMTSGLQKGELIVLAARPSMGKTALSLNMATHAAFTGASVGYFSLEMAAEQLSLRLLSGHSGIPHQNIKNASISQEEWKVLTDVASAFSSLKFFIDDTAMLNIMELRAKARKLKMDQGIDLLVIDYLQLLHSPRQHENRHQEVSEISRSLKALAKELEIPIVALSQLSRAVDSRTDKRPMLSDLRESGAIEQDADVIMFLYREDMYNKESPNKDKAELIIGKQRNGPTGTIHLKFLKELTRFEELDEFGDRDH